MIIVLLRIESPLGGKIKTRVRLGLRKWGKADKPDNGRSKVFACRNQGEPETDEGK